MWVMERSGKVSLGGRECTDPVAGRSVWLLSLAGVTGKCRVRVLQSLGVGVGLGCTGDSLCGTVACNSSGFM